MKSIKIGDLYRFVTHMNDNCDLFIPEFLNEGDIVLVTSFFKDIKYRGIWVISIRTRKVYCLDMSSLSPIDQPVDENDPQT